MIQGKIVADFMRDGVEATVAAIEGEGFVRDGDAVAADERVTKDTAFASLWIYGTQIIHKPHIDDLRLRVVYINRGVPERKKGRGAGADAEKTTVVELIKRREGYINVGLRPDLAGFGKEQLFGWVAAIETAIVANNDRLDGDLERHSLRDHAEHNQLGGDNKSKHYADARQRRGYRHLS